MIWHIKNTSNWRQKVKNKLTAENTETAISIIQVYNAVAEPESVINACSQTANSNPAGFDLIVARSPITEKCMLNPKWTIA